MARSKNALLTRPTAVGRTAAPDVLKAIAGGVQILAFEIEGEVAAVHPVVSEKCATNGD